MAWFQHLVPHIVHAYQAKPPLVLWRSVFFVLHLKINLRKWQRQKLTAQPKVGANIFLVLNSPTTTAASLTGPQNQADLMVTQLCMT